MSHFEGKGAKEHVHGKRAEAQGAIEIHGIETPGHIGAGADSLRETALFLVLLSLAHPSFSLFIALCLGMIVWKTGRSGWLGWARLERLHRLIAQEKYEIEHHRPQEREELVALYSEKGFSGQLLEEVVDCLMADEDRLLKVMLEEEMGLTLEVYEHPLKQALGAFVGAFIAAASLCGAYFLFPPTGVLAIACMVIGIGGAISALYDRNRVISAVVWNVAIAVLSYAISTFFLT